jgi:YgiT-type zinc finger domain-containing protein
MKQNTATHYTCNQCHAGMMRSRYVTYITRLGNELITVQNFPAYICDVCGRREYDEQSIHWLNTMLDPNAGKPTQTKRRTPPLPQPRSGFSHPLQDS